MVKGVSGALTRLAKVKSASPQRNGPGPSQPSGRSRAEAKDDDDIFYSPEDLEALSASQYLRRRAEAAKAEPVPAPAPAPTLASAPAPAPAAIRPDPAPVYADSGQRRSGGGGRVESAPWRDEDEDEESAGAARGDGRVTQRVRRIKTALAARIGRESEPSPVGRADAPAKGPGRQRAIDMEDDGDEEPGHAARGSFRPKQLARARRRLGMTQAEFARCFGLDTDDVVRWEEGGRPSRTERVLLTLIMHDPEETARLVDEAMPLK